MTPTCEICHVNEAVWYIAPLRDGQFGVQCCGACLFRRPADVADLWRERIAQDPARVAQAQIVDATQGQEG